MASWRAISCLDVNANTSAETLSDHDLACKMDSSATGVCYIHIYIYTYQPDNPATRDTCLTIASRQT